MKVAVGSQNPIKLGCSKEAFRSLWPEEKFEFITVSVSSGVSDQPMSDKECLKGAENRARKALRKGKTDYGVGIEGGIYKVNSQYFARAWTVVVNKKGQVGSGSSLSAPLPQKFMDLIHDGAELGKANDMITGGENTKEKEGYFGFISNNLITREKGYIDSVVMALARFKKPEIFE